MTKLEQFFYENRRYSRWSMQIETQEQRWVRGALTLAKAMRYALEQAWHFEWDEDNEPCNCGEDHCGHTVEYCELCLDWPPACEAHSPVSAGPPTTDRRTVEADLRVEATTK